MSDTSELKFVVVPVPHPMRRVRSSDGHVFYFSESEIGMVGREHYPVRTPLAWGYISTDLNAGTFHTGAYPVSGEQGPSHTFSISAKAHFILGRMLHRSGRVNSCAGVYHLATVLQICQVATTGDSEPEKLAAGRQLEEAQRGIRACVSRLDLEGCSLDGAFAEALQLHQQFGSRGALEPVKLVVLTR